METRKCSRDELAKHLKELGVIFPETATLLQLRSLEQNRNQSVPVNDVQLGNHSSSSHVSQQSVHTTGEYHSGNPNNICELFDSEVHPDVQTFVVPAVQTDVQPDVPQSVEIDVQPAVTNPDKNSTNCFSNAASGTTLQSAQAAMCADVSLISLDDQILKLQKQRQIAILQQELNSLTQQRRTSNILNTI